jgi:hypothetical protein
VHLSPCLLSRAQSSLHFDVCLQTMALIYTDGNNAAMLESLLAAPSLEMPASAVELHFRKQGNLGHIMPPLAAITEKNVHKATYLLLKDPRVDAASAIAAYTTTRAQWSQRCATARRAGWRSACGDQSCQYCGYHIVANLGPGCRSLYCDHCSPQEWDSDSEACPNCGGYDCM